MRSERLNDAAIAAWLSEHDKWRLEGNKLHRELRFADFSAAWGFMTRVALIAEQLDHHPEWHNVYNRVVVDLVTHDSGGITELDTILAQRIDTLL